MTVSDPTPNPGQEWREISDAALRMHDAVGFDSTTAVRLAEAGYDVTGFMAVRVVDDVAVAQ